MLNRLFNLGSIVMTQAVKELIESKENDIGLGNIVNFIDSHKIGEYGDISESDKKINELNLGQVPGIIISRYKINNKAGVNPGKEISVFILITKSDRSSTRVTLEDD